MATLNIMFAQMNNYNYQLNVMAGRMDTVNRKMLTVSKAASGVNNSVGQVSRGFGQAADQGSKLGTSLDKTNDKLKKMKSSFMSMVGKVANLDTVKKGMNIADSYANAKTKLNTVNDGSHTSSELQNKVMAASVRSGGNYTDMVGAVSQLSLSAGNSFKSNDEAIGFAELLQKSVSLSGNDAKGQQETFLRVTEAMSGGKMQGGDFLEVMQEAPMVAEAISQYMGVTTGELAKMSSEGLITADVIKNAMFGAAGEIEGKFAEMPVTFESVQNRIRGVGVQAFGAVFEKINQILNSDMGQAVLSNLTGLIYMVADGFSILLDGISWVVNHLDVFIPIVFGIAAAWLVYNSSAAIALFTTLKNVGAMALKAAADWIEYAAIFALIWAQEGFNAALRACPITWIIIAIIMLVALFYAGVAAVNHFAGTSLSATGLIAGAFCGLLAVLYNFFIYPTLAVFVLIANFICNVFNDPIAAVKVLFLDMAITCVDFIADMAKAIESIINKIPGVSIDITSGIEDFSAGLKDQVGKIKDESEWKEYIAAPELKDVGLSAQKGYDWGKNLGSKESDPLSSLTSDNLLGGADLNQFAPSGNPAAVEGIGNGGAVNVESEEDIEWMRKLAERDYVARIATNTLAPNIRVEFSGPITKEADVNSVATHLGMLLKDQIAIAPEGVYAT